jgi:hypothetical protein
MWCGHRSVVDPHFIADDDGAIAWHHKMWPQIGTPLPIAVAVPVDIDDAGIDLFCPLTLSPNKADRLRKCVTKPAAMWKRRHVVEFE